MSTIKVTVTRKSDNKVIYANEGDQANFEAMFDADIAGYDPNDFDIVKTDITQDKLDAAQKEVEKDAAIVRLRAIDTTKVLPPTAIVDLIKVITAPETPPGALPGLE